MDKRHHRLKSLVDGTLSARAIPHYDRSKFTSTRVITKDYSSKINNDVYGTVVFLGVGVGNCVLVKESLARVRILDLIDATV